MTEYKRVRENALLTDEEIRSAILGITNFQLLFAKQAAQAQLDKTLKTEGIEIRADEGTEGRLVNVIPKRGND